MTTLDGTIISGEGVPPGPSIAKHKALECFDDLTTRGLFKTDPITGLTKVICKTPRQESFTLHVHPNFESPLEKNYNLSVLESKKLLKPQTNIPQAERESLAYTYSSTLVVLLHSRPYRIR